MVAPAQLLDCRPVGRHRFGNYFFYAAIITAISIVLAHAARDRYMNRSHTLMRMIRLHVMGSGGANDVQRYINSSIAAPRSARCMVLYNTWHINIYAAPCTRIYYVCIIYKYASRLQLDLILKNGRYAWYQDILYNLSLNATSCSIPPYRARHI